MWPGPWAHLDVSHIWSTEGKGVLVGGLLEVSSWALLGDFRTVGVWDPGQGSGQLEIPARLLALRLLRWFCFAGFSCPCVTPPMA